MKRAAAAVGAVKTSGRRWVDQRDGIVRVSPFRSSCGRSLTLREREEIAIGLDRGWTCQAIGDAIGRDRSVIKREVDRNSNVTGVYRGYTAQLRADERLRRPKAAKIVANAQLRAEVIDKLVLRWSPEQISAHLKVEFADRAEMQVSHETIYQAVYVQAKGNLKAEVAQALRTGRAVRRAHGRVPSNARHIPDKIMISERPAEIADRAVPGHWEGDLIMGKANKSCDRDSRRTQYPARDVAASATRHRCHRCAGRDDRRDEDTAGRHAPIRDVGSRFRDATPRRDHRRDRGRDLLLRSTLPMATRDEREHQRATAPVLSEGNRSIRAQPRVSPLRRRPTQRPTT